MKPRSFFDFLIKACSSFFFIGYLPLIPGTFGSVAGVGLFYLLKGTSGVNYFLSILGLICLGLISCGKTERLLNKKDPGCIVIDEVVGMLIALSFIPYDLKIIFLAFLIFRVLDTLKPFPAGRLQNLHGSVGILADDLIAGIYTNMVMFSIIKLNMLV